MNSPVCKCAVPLSCRRSNFLCEKSPNRPHCDYCGLPLPKEVKCCEESKWNGGYMDSDCTIKACVNSHPLHSPNMTEVKASDFKDMKYQMKVEITPPPIHSHYNEEMQRSELCGRVVCPKGFVGLSVKKAPNTEASWEEEFERYYAWVGTVGNGDGPVKLKAYKDFIRSLLLSEKNKAREATLDEVLSWFGKDYDPTSYDWIVKRLEAARHKGV